MPVATNRRRELLGLLGLAAAIFIGLSLGPLSITGPLGRALGGWLWTYFGVGAGLLPLLLLAVGLEGLGRLQIVDLRRTAILFGGLVILLPFLIGIGRGIGNGFELPANHDNWTLAQQLIGIVPALLVDTTVKLVGAAGAVIVGLLGLSALTLYTIGWHPFRHVRWPGAARSAARSEFGSSGRTPDALIAPADEGRTRRVFDRTRRFFRHGPGAGDSGMEEQAFITDEAIEPFPVNLLSPPEVEHAAEDEAELDRLGRVLVDTLKTFRVEATLGQNRSTGPVVTQFEVAPAAGVKVGRIASLADDLALKMEARSIRIVAPIPGKAYVGVEVPNPTARIVTLRELLESPGWDPRRPGLPLALGRDLEGDIVAADLTKMPHLLIAGATGSGKSVCINTLITSLVYRYTERELNLLMIDPKMVELTAYNALPHLIHPVVTSNKDAAKALKWAMYRMEDRYELFHVNNVRNLHEFNRKVRDGKEVVMPNPEANGGPPGPQLELGQDPEAEAPPAVVPYTGSTLPYIVVIVDELADLMMTVQGEVEKPLATLAQKARATGIHLILSTQRPSVNVITGLIKANFPSRIAFRVASKVDSRTILDQNGAEALLGNGDMLFLPPGKSEPIRVQGAFIATEETERVTAWYGEQRERREARREGEAVDLPEVEAEDILAEVQAREAREEGVGLEGRGVDVDEWDPLFREAAQTCIQHQLGSTSLLQRKLRIGYGRAARIIDQLHEAGVLGPPDGSKPREVLVGSDELNDLRE